MKVLYLHTRSVTVLLDGEGDYVMSAPVSLTLNGQPLGEEKRTVVSLFDLYPDTDYTLTMTRKEGEEENLSFRTCEAQRCLAVFPSVQHGSERRERGIGNHSESALSQRENLNR